MKGFWNGLQSLLDSLQKRGLMRGDYHRRICFANSLDELVKYL